MDDSLNRVLFAADCLDALNDAEALPDSSIDLIYLDPPFNSNSKYNLPFKGKDKTHKPVEAFVDIWKWSDQDAETLDDLNRDPRTRPLATIVQFALEIESTRGRRGGGNSSLGSYLLNMALRLRAMRRVLKDTGSIYLHCDPTCGHYLKLLLDALFGQVNFRNEVVWHYGKMSNPAKKFPANHDTIFRYTMSSKFTFNLIKGEESEYRNRYKRFLSGNQVLYGSVKHKKDRLVLGRIKKRQKDLGRRLRDDDVLFDFDVEYKVQSDVIYVPIIKGNARERLGYPTQKPLALLERIIKASSNEGDTVLDPFCGCGTTVHAAESLGRKWIGIDISKFSTGLIRDRILHNFKYLNADDIEMRGTPDSLDEARNLARANPFEFEKWVCGYIGAEGMFREPGERGADGGVDGVLKFYPVREGKKVKPEYAIVQVKGGRVSPDNVKALHETVRRYEATAGVMVCFGDQLGTVENQRVKATFSDAWGSYPVIQGFSLESLLGDAQLDLPLYGYKRRGAMLSL